MDIAAIVPCFNGADFIYSSLDSIAKQTVPVRQVIFVDDGSEDASASVAERWANEHPEIELRIIQQANAGVSVARNTGVRAAECEWIAFLDVDDVWYPDHNEILTRLQNSLEACVLAFCDADRLQIRTGDGERLPSFFNVAGIAEMVSDKPDGAHHQCGGPVHTKLLTGSFVPTCSNLVKRSALLAVGGFQAGRAFGEDRELWLKLFAHGKVAISSQRGGRQLYHETNTTHPRNTIKRLRATWDLADDLLQDHRSYGISAEQISVLKEHQKGLARHLRYAASSSGLGTMLSERNDVRRMGGRGFSVRDWLRGLYRSIPGMASPED